MSAGGAGSEAALPRLPAHRRMEAWQVRPARAGEGQGARHDDRARLRQRHRHQSTRHRHLRRHTPRLRPPHGCRPHVRLLAMLTTTRRRMDTRSLRHRPKPRTRPRVPALRLRNERTHRLPAPDACITMQNAGAMPPSPPPAIPPGVRRLRGPEGSDIPMGRRGLHIHSFSRRDAGGSPLMQRDAAGGSDHDSRWSS